MREDMGSGMRSPSGDTERRGYSAAGLPGRRSREVAGCGARMVGDSAWTSTGSRVERPLGG